MAIAAAPVAVLLLILLTIVGAVFLWTLSIVVVAMAYWTLAQARNTAARLPVVGASIAASISALMAQLGSVARWQEQLAMAQINDTGKHLVWLVGAAMKGAVHLLHSITDQHLVFIQSLDARTAALTTVDLYELQAQAQTIQAFLENDVAPNLQELNRFRESLALYVPALTELAAMTAGPRARIESLEANYNALAGVVSTILTATLPGLVGRQLADEGRIGEALSRLRGAETALEGLQGAGGILRRDLDRLAPLGLLAGLGSVALSELAETARNPCRCIQQPGWDDLPSRVLALEVFAD